jgi:uncharacterized membrane protein YadS
VVGAAAQYGERALEVATAAKLARALWIVPVTFIVALTRARSPGADETASTPVTVPWFIAGFLGVAALTTAIPSIRGIGLLVAAGSHRLLAVTLFLTGLGMSRTALRCLGVRPLILAIALWLALGVGTLVAIVGGWIV